MNFNFETQRQYHTCDLESKLPAYVTRTVRVMTQSLEANTSICMMTVIHSRFIVKKPSWVKLEPYLYLDRDEKPQNKKQRLFPKKLKPNRKTYLRLLIRIRSVNRTKGVKLGFEYDHVAPSGFGVAPIKRLPTAMFSLVRIRPMFEQEAPK